MKKSDFKYFIYLSFFKITSCNTGDSLILEMKPNKFIENSIKESQHELCSWIKKKNNAKAELRSRHKIFGSTSVNENFMLKMIEEQRIELNNCRKRCRDLSKLLDLEYESSGDEDNWFSAEERKRNQEIKDRIKNFFFNTKEVCVIVSEKIYPVLKFVSSNSMINLFIKTSTGLDISCIEPLVAAFLGSAKVLDHISSIQKKCENESNNSSFKEISLYLGELLVKVCKEKKDIDLNLTDDTKKAITQTLIKQYSTKTKVLK